VTQGLGVAVEDSIGARTVAAMQAMGHHVTVEQADLAFGFGGAQAILRMPAGGYAAGSDPRKDGQAVGF
jgi:gamma-glutamyltranspeptidase/glutathione hydrolase